MTYQTPRTIKWRGKFYLISCTCDSGNETATVSPENGELQNVILQSLRTEPSKPLKVYLGFHGDYLVDDPKQGET